jgi:hypothetical protein
MDTTPMTAGSMPRTSSRKHQRWRAAKSDAEDILKSTTEKSNKKATVKHMLLVQGWCDICLLVQGFKGARNHRLQGVTCPSPTRYWCHWIHSCSVRLNPCEISTRWQSPTFQR